MRFRLVTLMLAGCLSGCTGAQKPNQPATTGTQKVAGSDNGAAPATTTTVRKVAGMEIADPRLTIGDSEADPGKPIHAHADAELNIEGSYRLVDPASTPGGLAADFEGLDGSGFATLGERTGDRFTFRGLIRVPSRPGAYVLNVWQGAPPERVFTQEFIIE